MTIVKDMRSGQEQRQGTELSQTSAVAFNLVSHASFARSTAHWDKIGPSTAAQDSLSSVRSDLGLMMTFESPELKDCLDIDNDFRLDFVTSVCVGIAAHDR